MNTTTHIERRHTITLPLDTAAAFALFTSKGEIAWVDDWRPEFLYPPDGEPREGMVFRTSHGGETTLWACVAWEPEAHHMRYARVTPESRFGFVDVVCRALAPDMTAVTVGYDFTALSPAGQAYLDRLTEAAFAAMIDAWRELIMARIIAVSGGAKR